MKKAFMFVVAIAMTLAFTASAKTGPLLFNRPQFQHHEFTCKEDRAGYDHVLLTVPLVYKGTVSLTDDSLKKEGKEKWSICEYDVEECKANNKDTVEHCCYIIDTKKGSYPVFMTICQPCIDCFPCTLLNVDEGGNVVTDAPYDGSLEVPQDFPENVDYYSCAALPGYITKWNLYSIDVNKKGKTTTVRKINLLDPDYEATFFTGAAKKAPAFMLIRGYNDLYLNGKKSDYTFKFQIGYLEDGNWVRPEDSKEAKAKYTAYIKSLASVSGTTVFAYYNDVDADRDCDWSWPLDVNAKLTATFKLTRDSSLTKKAITACFSGELPPKVKNWEDCYDPIPASWCEEYFLADEGDRFDEYLDGQYNKKGITYSLLDSEDPIENLLD